MIRIIKTMVAPILFAAVLGGCAGKQPPNKQGQLLTSQQIEQLGKDQSMNGKLIAIDGYASFCSMSLTLGKTNKMEIRDASDCDGKKLIDANVAFLGNIVEIGTPARNCMVASDPINNNSFKVRTDDYTEHLNGKFRYSGTLIYDGSTYYLSNVTIHSL